VDAPKPKRAKREPESYLEIKLEPEIEQDPFTMQCFFGFDR
jgi:hypothetical protein